ncbi:hypothetical protein H9638_02375 [Arthrobacter sp. Sa2BUA2]|uniref:Uncharacterized protein n=1 Tax=Arthrobacter pullicola TaxID=2762224 RepID=A0ABR8YEL0_9MICC|nr:hypothetical protein [Arthrobacter pullicola]MBD8042650.1 hypothetical protein [Arthrobacter pullicola]
MVGHIEDQDVAGRAGITALAADPALRSVPASATVGTGLAVVAVASLAACSALAAFASVTAFTTIAAGSIDDYIAAKDPYMQFNGAAFAARQAIRTGPACATVPAAPTARGTGISDEEPAAAHSLEPLLTRRAVTPGSAGRSFSAVRSPLVDSAHDVLLFQVGMVSLGVQRQVAVTISARAEISATERRSV